MTRWIGYSVGFCALLAVSLYVECVVICRVFEYVYGW